MFPLSLKLSTACAALALACGIQAIAGEKAQYRAGSGGSAIEHVTVLPMTAGSKPLRDMTLVIQGTRIVALEPSHHQQIPRGVRTIDGAGKWLMPSLTDMHVHIENPRMAEVPATAINDADLLLPYVANGVLQVMNMSAMSESVGQRDAVESGRLLGPHIALAAMVDGAPPYIANMARVAATPADGRQIVRDIKLEGYDFVKTYSRLTLETFTAIVDEARKQDLRVVGHIPQGSGPGLIEKYFQPGYAMVAHAEEFAYQEKPISQAHIPHFIEIALRNGIWLASTLVLDERILEQTTDLEAVMSRPETRYVYPPTLYFWAHENRYAKLNSPERVARLTEVVQFNRKLVRAFVQAGVPVVPGTDAYVPGMIAGFSLHEELEALAKVGMTNEQVLAAATRLPTQWLGVARDRGTIEVGKRADLLLLDADPLASVANTRKIAAVIASGRYLPSTELKQMMDDLAARYASWECAECEQ